MCTALWARRIPILLDRPSVGMPAGRVLYKFCGMVKGLSATTAWCAAALVVMPFNMVAASWWLQHATVLVELSFTLRAAHAGLQRVRQPLAHRPCCAAPG